MIVVKSTTKKGQNIIDTVKNRYDGYTLNEIYISYSGKKREAYNAIHDRAVSTKGYNYDFHITSHNTMMFCTGYTFTDEKGTHYIFDTPTYTYEVIE